MPEDIILGAKKSFSERLQKTNWNSYYKSWPFNERFQNLNWEVYYNDLPFNPSALSLYKWAPIAEELKSLDRKIVLNSMILKWNIIKKEFTDLIKF